MEKTDTQYVWRKKNIKKEIYQKNYGEAKKSQYNNE